MLEVGKFYTNKLGNKYKCLEKDGKKVKLWVLHEISEEKRVFVFRKDGKKEPLKTVTANITQDIKYADQYKVIDDEVEIKRLSEIWDEENKPQAMTRADFWRKQYRIRRYLEFLNDAELAQRLRDVVNNGVTLTYEGKLGFRRLQQGGELWIELFTHVHEEYCFRKKDFPKDVLKNARLPRPTWPNKPLGVDLVNKVKGLRQGEYLIKYGKSKYLKEAFQSGSIRINPASSYNDPSLNSAIKDDELRMITYGLPSEVTITHLETNTRIIPTSNVSYQSECSTDYYVYCVSNILDFRLFSDFEADSCLIIKDPEGFTRLLYRVMQSILFSWKGFNAPVKYIDPFNTRGNKEIILFVKHFRYAYQFEHRFLWLPETKMGELKPIDLNLGSLEAVAEYVDLRG